MQKRDVNNAFSDIAGESVWGFQTGLVASATVLVVALRQFGAGRIMIGSIASIETCGFLFPQVLGLYLFRSRTRRKLQVIAYHYLFMIPFLGLIAWILHRSPAISPVMVRGWVLACWGLYIFSMGIVTAVWMDWIAGLFDVRFRGTVMGLAFCGASVAGAAGGLLSGWMIQHRQGVQTYALLYGAAALLATLSISLFWFISDPAQASGDIPAPERPSIMGNFRQSLSAGNFRSFLIGRILSTFGFCILPLVTDYFSSAEGGAIPQGTLVKCGAAISVGTALANLSLGRIGDKFGHRLGLLIGAACQIAALLLLLFVPGQLGCILVYFAAGICIGSAFISHYNMVFETCTHDNRTAHITLANLIIGGCTVLAPILAGLAARYWGFRIVFHLSLGLSVLALAWFILRVREPRDANPPRLAQAMVN